MEFKRTLLAGVSAAALVLTAASGAWADGVDNNDDNADYNDQDIDIGSNNGAGGDGEGGGAAGGFNDSNAVAVAALQQSAVQIVGSENEEAIEDYDAEMDFGEDTFRNQYLNNNNFNTGVNVVQGNAFAIAGTQQNTLGSGEN